MVSVHHQSLQVSTKCHCQRAVSALEPALTRVVGLYSKFCVITNHTIVACGEDRAVVPRTTPTHLPQSQDVYHFLAVARRFALTLKFEDFPSVTRKSQPAPEEMGVRIVRTTKGNLNLPNFIKCCGEGTEHFIRNILNCQ